MNFNGNVRGGRDGVSFVLHGPDGRLLVTGGSYLFEPSVSDAELHAAWIGITFAVWEFRTERIFIKDDFAIVID